MVTDFDKVLAGQARNTERIYIVFGFHRGELVIGALDKPIETVARLCGHAVVVDENMMAHAQLGNVNLLSMPGRPAVYWRSMPTTLYLSRASNCSTVLM